MIITIKGIVNRKNILKYIPISNPDPAPMKKGIYGTPKNEAGRVHPRKNNIFFAYETLHIKFMKRIA